MSAGTDRTQEAARRQAIKEVFCVHETSYSRRTEKLWTWHCACGLVVGELESREECCAQTRSHWAQMIVNAQAAFAESERSREGQRLCSECQRSFTHPNKAVKTCDRCWEKSFDWLQHPCLTSDQARYWFAQTDYWRKAFYDLEKSWKNAVTKLLNYIEDHDWGNIPEPHDSIRELYDLLPERAARTHAENQPKEVMSNAGRASDELSVPALPGLHASAGDASAQTRHENQPKEK